MSFEELAQRTDAQTLEELADKHPIAGRVLEYRELAKLGVPIKTVKSRLHRALQELRARLARRYAAEGNDNGFAMCARLLALAPDSADVERVIGGMEEQLQGLRHGKMPAALLRMCSEASQCQRI